MMTLNAGEISEVRQEGKCDCCEEENLLSFVSLSSGHEYPGPDRQYCGYLCTYCGFGVAGDRPRVMTSVEKGVC